MKNSAVNSQKITNQKGMSEMENKNTKVNTNANKTEIAKRKAAPLRNERILAENFTVSNDTRISQLNNNDMIVGPSGAGKTTGYVIPNILQFNSSMVVADTKGNLHRTLSPALKRNGYAIRVIDFVHPENSSAYNPLDYIHRDPETGRFREQDIITVTNALVQDNSVDVFWSDSAKNVVSCLIGYVLEAFPRDKQNLYSVLRLYNLMANQINMRITGEAPNVPFLEEWALKYPDSFAVQKYRMFKYVFTSDRTWSSITQFVTNALSPFQFEEARTLFAAPPNFRFEDLGRRRTIVFLNVSDCDRAFDGLINLFYTQALQALINEADKNPDSRLKVPVRLILDDFATNAVIPDFDKTISVIRSREISVSVILQSLSQLESMYGKACRTIINNCDHILYLGGVDLDTAEYIAHRVSKPSDVIMNMPIDKVWVLERGQRGMLMDRIKPSSVMERIHDREDIPEKQEERSSDISKE
ncbi:MAG: type IV secretory system conjugative DNA transfer family protein [Oscillospiraceae bacterium]|nr:type IV secretory system conjugative DNA transfer family protein [Oscillospiraceae bacterium]